MNMNLECKLRTASLTSQLELGGSAAEFVAALRLLADQIEHEAQRLPDVWVDELASKGSSITRETVEQLFDTVVVGSLTPGCSISIRAEPRPETMNRLLSAAAGLGMGQQ
jgi:hypothetical protein